jgi:hypothetical protein
MMRSRIPLGVLFLLSLACLPACGKETPATIIYDDRATEIAAADQDAGQLWITTDDLKRATGFELKPQGGMPERALLSDSQIPRAGVCAQGRRENVVQPGQLCPTRTPVGCA